uniref:Transposase n=1 Tax=Fusarium oxysporum (strain Fo5176) TaxID=660025 RepID=A0A0D2XSW8_FUSOF
MVNFIKAYAKAREVGMTKKNILSGWRTSRHIRDLGKNKSPSTRRRYSVISKGFEAQESKIASLSTRIASLEEEVGRLSRGKKRKAIPNPNKKFMTLAEALAAGDTILEPNEAIERADVVEDMIEVGGMEEDERSNSGKEELGVVRTRTGREVKRPRKY